MGSVVDCPRCQKSVIVPLQSAPQAEQLYQMLKNKRSQEMAAPPPVEGQPQSDQTLSDQPQSDQPQLDLSQSEPTEPESAWDELGGNVDNADLNRWIDELWTTVPASPQEMSPADSIPIPMPNPITSDEVALIALQKRYRLTVTLLYVSSAIAFFVGAVFGISFATFFAQPTRPYQYVSGGAEDIPTVTGTLYFLNRNGERQPDVDAVIICLPKDRLPNPLFSCEGLLPEDVTNNDTVQLIRELGGMYERADSNGSFTLHYQAGVRYFVILISANQAQPNGIIKPSVLQELRRYFHNPGLFAENCLSADEYEWSGGQHSLGRITFETTD